MATVAVIGLGTFGCRVTEELIDADADIIIIDKDREVVEKYKNSVLNAYITDALSEETLRKVIPQDIDAAIVDLGNLLESSILVTNHLKKIGVSHIIVKARSNEHGEILKLVGATKIIYPDLDAAIHITPMILNNSLFNYMQLSENFAIAEVEVHEDSDKKTLAESSLREKFYLNVIGIRLPEEKEIISPTANTILEKGMILLVAGPTQAIKEYSDKHKYTKEKQDSGKNSKIFNRWLRR